MEYGVTTWKRPDNYVGAAWHGYFVAPVAISRDSSIMERTNFGAQKERIMTLCDGAQVIREGHWAVGWIEWLAIPAECGKAVREARKIADELNSYPVLDDDRYSKAQLEAAYDYYDSADGDERRYWAKRGRGMVRDGASDEEAAVAALMDEVIF